VAPRYGNRPLEITPGKFAARMQSDQVPAFFYKPKQLVEQGHYDEQFAKLNRRFLQMCSHYLVDPVAWGSRGSTG